MKIKEYLMQAYRIDQRINSKLEQIAALHAGFTMVPFGQGFASMSTPTEEFYRLLMEGKIVHAGHPVLRWMAGNVVIETDAAENIKVTKAKSKEKIDGIVASIMALDRCLRNQGEPQGSVYDERGLLVF